jgi:hypothetical protein
VQTLMLAGLKTQWSQCVTRRQEPYKVLAGFFADQLHDVLQELPAWLWPEPRRKRTYVNQVLARAEVHSSYQPARRLWVRTRNGHYFPNPQMRLRVGDGWQPVYERLALQWIDRGCGREIDSTGCGRWSRSSGCARRWSASCRTKRRRQTPKRRRQTRTGQRSLS